MPFTTAPDNRRREARRRIGLAREQCARAADLARAVSVARRTLEDRAPRAEIRELLLDLSALERTLGGLDRLIEDKPAPRSASKRAR